MCRAELGQREGSPAKQSYSADFENPNFFRVRDRRRDRFDVTASTKIRRRLGRTVYLHYTKHVIFLIQSNCLPGINGESAT
jgi:hypothetical protein